MAAEVGRGPVVRDVGVEAVEAQADDRLEVRRERDLVLRVSRGDRRDAVVVGVGDVLAERHRLGDRRRAERRDEG